MKYICNFFMICNILYGSVVHIPGTQLLMNKPKSFKPASQFAGFIDNSTGSSIMSTNLPIPLKNVRRNFSDRQLSLQKITCLHRGRVRINGFDGELINIEQTVKNTIFMKWILLFGDHHESIVLIGTFLKKYESKKSDAIKNTLLSVQWNRSEKITSFAGMPFHIEEITPFKIAKKMGYTLLLTREGEFPLSSETAPYITIGASISEKWKTGKHDLLTLAKKRFEQLQSHRITSVEKITKVVYDNLSGYTFMAEGVELQNKKTYFIYMTFLLSDKGYYIFQGFSDVNKKEKYSLHFTSIMESFRLVE